MRRAPIITNLLLALVALPAAADGDLGHRMEALEQRGIDEMTPVETEMAREFIENGDEEMANLQLDLLEATASAAEREALAEQTEIAALGAEKDVMVEQAAYEFLVEQILASGVAAFWSAP